ncbi:MAG: dihydroorotase [Actinomycetota bacterium]|nr:dihydroorotase [Actinomycetota bacterium]
MADSVVISGGLLSGNQSDRAVDLLVDSGVIAEIAPVGTLTGKGLVVDAADALLLPGFVDIQVHFRTPGGEESEDISSGAAGAALGGVTACVMMPNTIPTIDSVALVNEVLSIGRTAPCEVHTSASVTQAREGRQLVNFEDLYAAGVRVFTDDGTVVDDANLMEGALSATCNLPGAVISQHAEHSQMVAGGIINDGAVAKRLGLKGRPREAEAVIVERDLHLAEVTKGRYHVLHISTSLAADLVRSAKSSGVRVTAEVTPQHLILTEDDVERLGTSGKMNPPLRTSSDVEALRTGIFDGTIDAVATDHAPHSPASKDVGLADAPPGMLGVETMASVIWTEFVDSGLMSVERFVTLLSYQPAQIANIESQGQPIQVGGPANIAVFDPKIQWTADHGSLQSKSYNNPWVGKQLVGRVRHTICNGKLVVADGALI